MTSHRLVRGQGRRERWPGESTRGGVTQSDERRAHERDPSLRRPNELMPVFLGGGALRRLPPPAISPAQAPDARDAR